MWWLNGTTIGMRKGLDSFEQGAGRSYFLGNLWKGCFKHHMTSQEKRFTGKHEVWIIQHGIFSMTFGMLFFTWQRVF